MSKLTQEQVSQLKSRKLNKKIAYKLGLKYAGNEQCRISKGVYVPLPDYCNNWNDLMPLVVEYKILDLYPFMELGTSMHENPQRALAECLFLVLQEKHDNE